MFICLFVIILPQYNASSMLILFFDWHVVSSHIFWKALEDTVHVIAIHKNKIFKCTLLKMNSFYFLFNLHQGIAMHI